MRARLARAGGTREGRQSRVRLARWLTEANLTICQRNGWKETVARCQVLLAELDLADHDLVEARVYLTAAITTFRAGDHLTELAGALTVAAGLARRAGDLDPAEHHAHEAGSVRSRPGRAHPR
jgi:hypothetical protein